MKDRIAKINRFKKYYYFANECGTSDNAFLSWRSR